MFRSSFQCNRWRGQADARVRTVGKSRADPRAAHRVERRCRARFTARAESIVYILFAACERPLIVLLVRMRICLAAASRPMHERPRTVGCARLQLVLGGGGGWAGGDGDKARWSTLPAVAGGGGVRCFDTSRTNPSCGGGGGGGAGTACAVDTLPLIGQVAPPTAAACTARARCASRVWKAGSSGVSVCEIASERGWVGGWRCCGRVRP